MKIIGSRADVYNGRADRTSGGLTKSDIICKEIGGKILYISQKVSNHMKEVIKKRNNTRKPIIKHISFLQCDLSNVKTKKNVKFNLENNEVKQFHYDELDGQDIKQLQQEMNNEECDTNNIQKQEFTIQIIDDKALDIDIEKLIYTKLE